MYVAILYLPIAVELLFSLRKYHDICLGGLCISGTMLKESVLSKNPPLFGTKNINLKGAMIEV